MLAKKGFLAFALTLCLSSAAFAAPNLVGPSGLLYTPSTEIAPTGWLDISVSTTGGAPRPEFPANYGFNQNWEAGATRLGEIETIVNVKYLVQAETAKRIALAAGLMDVTDQQSSVLYAVASKGFTPDIYGVDNFHCNLGMAIGGKKMVDSNKGPIPGSLQLNGPFAGLNFDIAKRVTAMAEYDGRNFNYGLRGAIVKHVTGIVGIVGPDHNVAAGVSYDFKI